MKNSLRLRLKLREDMTNSGRGFLILCVSLGLNLCLNLDLLHAASFGLADRVVEQKLTNGLTILMVERHQTPVVSLNMTFAVGGVNEQVGQTGLAHLIRTARGLAERQSPDLATGEAWAWAELQRLCPMAKAPPTGGEWRAW